MPTTYRVADEAARYGGSASVTTCMGSMRTTMLRRFVAAMLALASLVMLAGAVQAANLPDPSVAGSAVGFSSATVAVNPPVATLPKLYVYRWAPPTGPATIAQDENMLGRKVDGVVDFNDYRGTAANAASNADWDLGQWQGKVPDIIYKVGLCFSDKSIQDVAAGKADATYTHIGQSLVSHGFPHATVPLGWEMNGGWYCWGQKGSLFGPAFIHAAAVIKAACPGCIIDWNPTAGLDPSSEWPAGGAGVDEIGNDAYANSWNCGGCKQQEQDLYNGNNAGRWGNRAFYPSSSTFKTAKSYAVPEFGAGSRGDGHGTCPATTTMACDDQAWITHALADFIAARVSKIGDWDVNAGDYNSETSWGERPGQAIAFLQVYGPKPLQAFLAGATAYKGALKASISGCPGFLAQLKDGSLALITWAPTAKAVSGTLTLSASRTVSAFHAADGSRPGWTPFRTTSTSWTVQPGMPTVVTIPAN